MKRKEITNVYDIDEIIEQRAKKVARRLKICRALEVICPICSVVICLTVVILALVGVFAELKTALAMIIWVFLIIQIIAGAYITGYWDGYLHRIGESIKELKAIEEKKNGKG